MRETKDLVLVIDDDQDALNEMSDGLRDWGLNVLTASSGEESLKICEEKKPAFVLMDFALPGMHGVNAVKILRKSLPNTVFIMMSGFDEFCDVATTDSTHSVAILKKPLTIDSVARFVRSHTR